MGTYQGRALERPARARTGGGLPRGRGVLWALLTLAAIGGLAMLPWREMRRRYAVVTQLRVTGVRYLDTLRVIHDASLAVGQDLPSIDLARVRQHVMMDPRIERAEVRHLWLRGLEVRVTERVAALAVTHGTPWEIDTSGVLLEPLQAGVVADVPMLTGADLSDWSPGAQIRTPQVQRGLAWAAVLSDNALRLAGRVSEVDVSQARTTRLILMNGVSVIGPAWPATTRQLSGLRATLADLDKKGMMPGEVDVRIPDQIIVRDVRPTMGVPPAGTS